MPIRGPLLAADSFNFHAKGVDTFTGSDKKRAAIFASETHVGRPVLWDRNMFYLFAGRVEDEHSFAGEINVALIINGQAVGSHLAKELFILQRAVRSDTVTVSPPRADVGHVEFFAVRRADDAVGLLQIINAACRRALARSNVIDTFAILFFRSALPIR